MNPTFTRTLAALALLAALAGCSDYSDKRPDPNQLVSGDAGLQSKDLISCTNQMAGDLTSNPQLNSSPTQWTLVVEDMQDQTTDRSFGTNYNIFIESLKSALSEKAQGRIQLIENKAQFNSLRDKEIEGGSNDPYGQGGGGKPGSPAAMNPQFGLYGKAIDMPNRETNFYLLQFNVTNLSTRALIWSRTYQVKVSRS